jgi:hypothetical protein
MSGDLAYRESCLERVPEDAAGRADGAGRAAVRARAVDLDGKSRLEWKKERAGGRVPSGTTQR